MLSRFSIGQPYDVRADDPTFVYGSLHQITHALVIEVNPNASTVTHVTSKCNAGAAKKLVHVANSTLPNPDPKKYVPNVNPPYQRFKF